MGKSMGSKLSPDLDCGRRKSHRKTSIPFSKTCTHPVKTEVTEIELRMGTILTTCSQQTARPTFYQLFWYCLFIYSALYWQSKVCFSDSAPRYSTPLPHTFTKYYFINSNAALLFKSLAIFTLCFALKLLDHLILLTLKWSLHQWSLQPLSLPRFFKKKTLTQN